ncbi:MAG: hypothetical protein JWO19_6119 [Bryobacterales bacterium]|nr:hypothetical protein [Bryobacterales bacterium]
MSINHQVPRQDRRGVGRSPVKPHDGQKSVGTNKPTILDPTNGSTFSGQAGAGGAPGSSGPAITQD